MSDNTQQFFTSMCNPRLLKQLAEFFVTLTTTESTIEAQRLKLAQIEDFDLHSAFQRIDKENYGSITSRQLFNFLSKYCSQLSETDTLAFYDIFNSDADEKLSLSDFIEAVLPSTNLILRQSVVRRHTYHTTVSKVRLNDLDRELAYFLRAAISLYSRICLAKQTLIHDPEWNEFEAFNAIDIGRVGYLDRYCLFAFMKNHTKAILSLDALLPLFRRLDKDHDGMLSFLEFQAIFARRSLESKEPRATGQKYDGSNLESNLENMYSTPLKSKKTGSFQKESSPHSSQPLKGDINQAGYLYLPRQLNSSSSISGDKSSNDHLDNLLHSALKRSQEKRTRSVPKSRDAPWIGDEVALTKPKEILRSTPKKSLRFQEESPDLKNRYSKISFQPTLSFPGNNAYADLPSHSKTLHHHQNQNSFFRFAHEQISSGSIMKNSIKYPSPSLEKNPKTISQVYLDQRSVEVFPSTSLIPANDNERKRLVESIVMKYANLPLSHRETSSHPLGNNADTHSILQNKLGTPSKQEIKLKVTQKLRSTTPDPQSRSSEYKNDHLKSNRSRTNHGWSISPRRIKNLQTNDHELLAKALKEIADLDNQLDSVRQVLAYHSDFTIPAAYRLVFDKTGANTCKLGKFAEILKNRGIQLDFQETKLIFERFDKDRDGNISLEDFEKLIIPRDPGAAEVLEGRKSEYIHKNETQNLINKFIEMVVGFELSVQCVLQKLSKNPKFNLKTALHAMDFYGEGFITIEVLRELAEMNVVNLRDKDLEMLMARYDLDKDGKIQISQLIEELTPKRSE